MTHQPHAPIDTAIRSRRSARGGAGVGLLVVLIAVAIILIVMFGNFGTKKSYVENVVESKKTAQQTVSQITARSIAQVVATHRMQHDELPSSPEALDDPDLNAYKDPWGTLFQFSYDTPRAGAPTLILISAGPDTTFGTDDDLELRERLPF